MQTMKMKRFVPTYVLCLALAIGVATGGLIAIAVTYLADQSSDAAVVTSSVVEPQPAFHRPMDERSLGGQQGARSTVPVSPDQEVVEELRMGIPPIERVTPNGVDFRLWEDNTWHYHDQGGADVTPNMIQELFWDGVER